MCRLGMKRERKKRNLTQEFVAKLVGFKSKQAYSNLERGQRGTTAEKWDALEDLFGIDQRELRFQYIGPKNKSAAKTKRRKNMAGKI